MAEITTDPTVHIFCSYSHKDEGALDALKAHLSEVRRQGLIDAWHDRMIRPGEDWSRTIDEALETADLVLLLVSSDFLASAYCNGVELKRALERACNGQTRIIPIYVRHAYWEKAAFARFQGLPIDARPVYSKNNDPDEAWTELVEGIVLAAREVRGEVAPKKKQIAPPPFHRPSQAIEARGEVAPKKNQTTLPPIHRPSQAREVRGEVAPEKNQITSTQVRRRSRSPFLLTLGLAVVLLLAGIAIWWLLFREDPALTASLLEARQHLNTGRYEQALQSFEKALELEPDNPEAVFGRKKAAVFAGMGPDFDVENAGKQLRALEQIRPDDPHVQVMLARLAAIRGDLAGARRLYEKVTDSNPDVDQAWFALCFLSHEEGELEKAGELYRKAAELAPNHRLCLTNLASVLMELGDYDAARTAYENILAVSPHLLLARLDAGNAARLSGDLSLATWHHDRLVKDLGHIEKGDNAAQWVFNLPDGKATMDAPDTKRAYILLTVSATRCLTGDTESLDEVKSQLSGLPELERAKSVIARDLNLLAGTRPEWHGKIAAFRESFGLSGTRVEH